MRPPVKDMNCSSGARPLIFCACAKIEVYSIFSVSPSISSGRFRQKPRRAAVVDAGLD